jgi:hypothetical protein
MRRIWKSGTGLVVTRLTKRGEHWQWKCNRIWVSMLLLGVPFLLVSVGWVTREISEALFKMQLTLSAFGCR